MALLSYDLLSLEVKEQKIGRALKFKFTWGFGAGLGVSAAAALATMNGEIQSDAQQ